MDAPGTESLQTLGAKLKQASRGDLRRGVLRDMRRAGAPLVSAARESALRTLPKSGGLNEIVAASKIAVRSRLSGPNASVRIVGVNPHHLRTINRGHVRHPTFGHEPWTTQAVTPGWWTAPMQAGSAEVRAAIIRSVNDTLRKL